MQYWRKRFLSIKKENKFWKALLVLVLVVSFFSILTNLGGADSDCLAMSGKYCAQSK